MAGLTNIDNLVLGSYNELILPKSDLLKSFASLRPTAPFRDSFVYNNNCYAVAGVVIEKITGMSLSRALHERLFAPLGMTRTGLRWPGHDVDDDVARAYKTLADGTQWEIPPPGSSEGTIWEAAGGVKSTISDLTRFYAAVLDSMAPLESRNRYRGAGGRPNVSTVKEGRTLYGGHNRRPASNLNEAGYALGWYRTQLPGNINTGNNKFYFPDGPIVGRGVDPTLCFHHNGLMPGSTSSVYLLPSHNTAIIVLHNGNAYGDAAVWSGQILVEAILNCPAVNDWAALAERGALGMLRHQPALQQELDSHQTLHDPGSEVAQYAGTYWNHAHLYKIAVEVGKGSNGSKNELRMKFQGLENERFGLRPYQMDAFRWDFDYDTACKLAREIPDFQAENYVMRFLRGGEGRVNALTWRWDDHFEKPEVFERE